MSRAGDGPGNAEPYGCRNRLRRPPAVHGRPRLRVLTSEALYQLSDVGVRPRLAALRPLDRRAKGHW
jgi:hypothetical protein